MKLLKGIFTLFVLVMFVSALSGCAAPVSTDSTSKDGTTFKETYEFQPRGNGIAELVSSPVYTDSGSIKLAIPGEYTFGDAARVAIPLDDITLNDMTDLSFWYYIDESTPVNQDGGYWLPYVTFELDTDGKAGCDTWVIGGEGVVYEEAGVWLQCKLKSEWLFHVPSNIPGYQSPFQITSMGTISEIKSAMGPDGKTSLGDCPVDKIRLAIGNWGEGGPEGPVICYVDQLVFNEKVLMK